MEKSKSWLDYKSSRLLPFFYKPFIIYARQFPKMFIFSLIIEFIFFGIFQLIIFDVGISYNIYTGGPILVVGVDFVSDFGRAFFFAVLIFAISFFIFRSTLISNTSWLTFEKGKANIAIILESTFRKIKEILLLTIFMAAIMVFPILLVILSLLLMPADYYLSWIFLIAAFVLPYIFGVKLSLYNAAMVKENLHVGTSLQTSWNLTKQRNWYKTSIVFTFYTVLGIIGPWVLTSYFNQIFDYIYLGIIMVFVRAFLYPLFDIAMTHLYLNCDNSALNQAVFKDEIQAQRERSEEFIAKVSKKN